MCANLMSNYVKLLSSRKQVFLLCYLIVPLKVEMSSGGILQIAAILTAVWVVLIIHMSATEDNRLP